MRKIFWVQYGRFEGEGYLIFANNKTECVKLMNSRLYDLHPKEFEFKVIGTTKRKAQVYFCSIN